MAQDNRKLINKADMAISDLTGSGGYLESEQAVKFIQVAIKKSKLLQECSVLPMRSPKRLLETFRFGSRIMHVGTSGQALAEASRTVPNLGKSELSTVLFKAEVRIPYEVLEDNIERDGLKSTIMQKIPEAAGRDIEEFVLMGDATTPSADADLAAMDGLLIQATTNTVNVASAAISQTVLRNMMAAMPAEFKADKGALRYYVSVNTEEQYRDLLGQRANEGHGVVMHDTDKPVKYTGVPITPLAMMSESGSVASALLVHPKNINVGIQKKIQILTDEDVSAGVVIIVARMRIDTKFTYEPAVVKAYDIAV